jgi:hypothetical protein
VTKHVRKASLLTNLETARSDFEAKIAEATNGGPPAMAVKNDARAGLLGMLRQLASYLQMNCNNDMAILLGSGFQAMSTNRIKVPLEQPIGLVLQNGTSGQLVGSVKPVKNTSLYEGRIKGPTGIGSRQC